MVRGNRGYMVSHTASTNNNNNWMMPTPSSTQLSISRYICLPQESREELITSSSKKPRVRPVRSKNKPKPPVLVKENTDATMETIIIEIHGGKDIMGALIDLAGHHRSIITVLKDYGFVTDVTLINLVSHALLFPIEGMFHMMCLSRTYLNAYCGMFLPNSSLIMYCPLFRYAFLEVVDGCLVELLEGQLRLLMVFWFLFLKNSNFVGLPLSMEEFLKLKSMLNMNPTTMSLTCQVN
jgi:hypothetical protein